MVEAMKMQKAGGVGWQKKMEGMEGLCICYLLNA